MKYTVITLFILLVCANSSSAQSNSETKEVSKLIFKFAEMGEKQNVDQLDLLLNKDFRIVMNQLFNSSEVSIMPKEVYLQKIEKKEFGGEKKKVTIQNLQLLGNIASAKVLFQGAKLTFTSLIHLIKNDNGNWQLIEEMPIM